MSVVVVVCLFLLFVMGFQVCLFVIGLSLLCLSLPCDFKLILNKIYQRCNDNERRESKDKYNTNMF